VYDLNHTFPLEISQSFAVTNYWRVRFSFVRLFIFLFVGLKVLPDAKALQPSVWPTSAALLSLFETKKNICGDV
jgi:hypothetical protein